MCRRSAETLCPLCACRLRHVRNGGGWAATYVIQVRQVGWHWLGAHRRHRRPKLRAVLRPAARMDAIVPCAHGQPADTAAGETGLLQELMWRQARDDARAMLVQMHTHGCQGRPAPRALRVCMGTSGHWAKDSPWGLRRWRAGARCAHPRPLAGSRPNGRDAGPFPCNIGKARGGAGVCSINPRRVGHVTVLGADCGSHCCCRRVCGGPPVLILAGPLQHKAAPSRRCDRSALCGRICCHLSKGPECNLTVCLDVRHRVGRPGCGRSGGMFQLLAWARVRRFADPLPEETLRPSAHHIGNENYRLLLRPWLRTLGHPRDRARPTPSGASWASSLSLPASRSGSPASPRSSCNARI